MKKFVTLMSLIAFVVCLISPAGAVASQQAVQDHDVGWHMPTVTIHSSTVMADNYFHEFDLVPSTFPGITHSIDLAAGKEKMIDITGIVPLQRYWEGGSTKASIRKAAKFDNVNTYSAGDHIFSSRPLKFGRDIRRLTCN